MSDKSKKKPILQLLISSKGKKNFNFLDEMFHKCDADQFSILLVDQTKRETNFKPLHKKYSFAYFNIPSNGLSNSRNFAINKSYADICLICDDDVVFEKDFANIIIESFQNEKSADIITFRANNSLNKLFKKYPNKTIHNYKTIAYINSFLIAFKRSKIIDRKVFFDPLFGLGSIFQTADEYIFLRDALEKKLNLLASKKIILKHKEFSSGQNAGSDKIIFARSAVFSKYYGNIAYLKLIHHIYLLLINGKIKFHEIIVKFMAGFNGIKKYKIINE
jgi:hypothetical protein|tara:strand:+ start:674 stop:1501 length:828 start_codon:yes stop_codon:yes gene_type:complete